MTSPPKQSWTALLDTVEGHVLWFGLVLSLLAVGALAMSWLWWPDHAQILLAMTATNIVFGRVVALSFGYAADLGHVIVLFVNMLIETILVLLFYPLFVFSWRHVVELKGLRSIIQRTTQAAEKKREWVHRYGIVGLFVFVWFPFWMTGPMVGCAIGFLLGLRTWINLSVVLISTYLAIIGWALLLRKLQDLVTAYSVFGPMTLVVIIILLILVGYTLHGVTREHKDGGDIDSRQ